MSRSPHPWGLDTALPACRCCYSLKPFFCRLGVVFWEMSHILLCLSRSIVRASPLLGGEIVTRSFHLRAR